MPKKQSNHKKNGFGFAKKRQYVINCVHKTGDDKANVRV